MTTVEGVVVVCSADCTLARIGDGLVEFGTVHHGDDVGIHGGSVFVEWLCLPDVDEMCLEKPIQHMLCYFVLFSFLNLIHFIVYNFLTGGFAFKFASHWSVNSHILAIEFCLPVGFHMINQIHFISCVCTNVAVASGCLK